ncbi:type I toxin-antitoxin system Ibs family toxin [Citrobacter sp. RHB21-C05]|nr:type I toxin-antitoxin system Ibs family toxin [Citrobacter sedlakii]QMK45588.1 type I toxin-antitoxin system Ibs family toxin [Citrobacter sp. RHB21-C05]QMK64032.1 type I toxin-antitoxin system Ibs family toxin [Citrobacter sp. RHB21-C01]
MMKSVIILVRLLVMSFQAYSDTRGRGDPPLPSLLKLSHTTLMSMRLLAACEAVSGKQLPPSAPVRRLPNQSHRRRQSECPAIASPALF